MRTKTFNLFFDMMNELQDSIKRELVVVETGTIRGDIRSCDGNSTVNFSEYIKQRGGVFYSIDCNKEAIEYSRKVVGERKNVHIVEEQSTKFLDSFPGMIDVLYLDSANDEHIGLSEYEAAKPKLHDHTIILIDDCLENSPNQRKGLLSIPQMIEDGYTKVLHEYQCILAREKEQ